MALHVVPVHYGAPALEALADAVAEAKGDEPLQPVTIVVPSNYAGVAARRALARRTGLAAVGFVTVYRLAELLAGPTLATQGRVPLSSPVLTTALRAVLADHGGIFRSVAGQPATVEALRRVHRELRELDDEQLAALGRTDARADAVVAIDRRVTDQLRGRWFDETDLTLAAQRLVHGGGAASLGPVVVHLPQRLTASAGALLLSLAGVGPVTVILGLTDEPSADRGAGRVLRQLGIDEVPRPPPAVHTATVERIVATDPDDEVRTVLRRIVAAAADGTPLERIVIGYPPGTPYGRLLTDHFAAAGLPWNGVASARLAERVAGRALLGLLDLDAATLSRHDLFALLVSLPAKPDRPVALWERHSRRAGVVTGAAEWQDRLALYAAERRETAEDADEDGPEAAAVRRVEVDQVESLRAFVAELADRLRPPTHPSWTAHARWARRLLELVVGGEQARRSWSPDEQRAADRVEAVLDRLAQLDAVTSAAVDASVFRAAVDAELQDGVSTVGRLGQGVFAGPLPLATGIEADLVIVLGMVEGGLPGAGADDPLLSDRSRRALGGALATTQERRDALQHQLLALADAACDTVVASRPRSDLRTGAGHYPSRWLDTVTARGAPGGVHEQASFQAGLRGPLPPGSEQEALVRDLQALVSAGHAPEEHVATAADPALHAALRLVRARDSDRFTEFDGNLAALTASGVELLVGDVFSPTALEAWTACPFAYFMRHVLGLREVENPEDVLSMRPTDRGSLIHRVLEDVLEEAIAAGTVPKPGEAWPDAVRRRLDTSFDDHCADAEARGHVGRALHWRFEQRRLRRLLEVFEEFDFAARAQYGVRPHDTELSFGQDRPLVVTLPSGRTLRLVGKVDRVDTSSERVVVVDYKTSGAPTPWNEDPFAGPIRLQLPIYGLAARRDVGGPGAEVVGEYWHLHRDATRRRRRIVSVDEVTQRRLPGVLEVITDGINGGLFVQRPDPPDPWRPWIGCPACDPDGVGTATPWWRWQRKRAAPELQAYVGLVEPDRAATEPDPEAS